MKNFMAAILAALVLASPVAGPSVASAAATSVEGAQPASSVTVGTSAPVTVRFGMNAMTFAHKIDCKRAYRPGGHAAARFHIRDSVVCWLHRHRLNVITFRDYQGQQRWENALRTLASLERDGIVYWASAHGVTFIAKNDNKPAACAGYRAVRGNHDAHAFWIVSSGDWDYAIC
jgi:hypothetical protein